ncbi:serine/threonine protein kinase [Pendulispora albinea]|uniref:Protein kinase n=1 Tax=Pendulispora albinea TaxID=2741071 RepID=A0ABZ2M8I8_9BACT
MNDRSSPPSPFATATGSTPAATASGGVHVGGGDYGRVGRYETLARLGTGGMATVFVGRALGDTGLSQLVALKRAHEHVRSDPELIEGLKREARLAARIHHPNVVGVIDIHDDGGDVVLVLDYVEGCTLSDLMRRLDTARFPREMLRILLDAASGLDAAHRTFDESGRPLYLVHRDVSPSNVLIGRDGVARIADFGVAKTLERSVEQTATGVLKGKLAYMAPEYVERHYVDARSDLFSLGVVTWEMVTGERLFKGPTELETLKRVAAQNIPYPSAYFPHLEVLDSTILRALARHPDHRYSSVGEFAYELEAHAREGNLVGSHIEVAALVEGVFGAELNERRQRFSARGADATAPVSQVHPSLDVPSFTQSAPAQSMTQSAVLASRTKLSATIPLSLLIIIAAVSTGALLAHRSAVHSSPAPPPPPPRTNLSAPAPDKMAPAPLVTSAAPGAPLAPLAPVGAHAAETWEPAVGAGIVAPAASPPEPSRMEPSRTEPSRTEHARTEPARTDPAHVEHARGAGTPAASSTPAAPAASAKPSRASTGARPRTTPPPPSPATAESPARIIPDKPPPNPYGP